MFTPGTDNPTTRCIHLRIHVCTHRHHAERGCCHNSFRRILTVVVSRGHRCMPRSKNRLFDGGLLRHHASRFAAIMLAVLVVTLWAAVPTPVSASATRLTDLPSTWVDDRGQPFDLRSMYGRTVVLSMAYATCHRVCPRTVDYLRRLQNEFDSRGVSAEFLVIGYDPDSDDVAAWRQYRRTRHLTRTNWHFLVGARADVEQVARQLGFEFWKMDQHVIHNGRVVRFDQRGVVVSSDAVSGL